MSRSCLGMLMTVATLFAGAAWAGDVSTDAATSYATSISAAGRIPKLQDCDVGVRFSGDAVPVEVRVTNDQVVTVRNATCTCVVSEPTTQIISKGTTAVFRVTWKTPYQQGALTTGMELSWQLPLESAEVHAVALACRGDFQDLLAVDKLAGPIRMNQVDGTGAESTTEVILERGKHPAAWDQIEIRSSVPFLRPAPSAVDHDHWRIALSLDHKQLDVTGFYSATLTLSFLDHGNPLTRTITRRVVGKVAGLVRPSPGMAYWSNLGEDRHQTVMLSGATRIERLTWVDSALHPLDGPSPLKAEMAGTDTDKQSASVIISEGPEAARILSGMPTDGIRGWLCILIASCLTASGNHESVAIPIAIGDVLPTKVAR